jgi:hypothetical protein
MLQRRREAAHKEQKEISYGDDMYILQWTSWEIFACNNSKMTKVANKNITYISYFKKCKLLVHAQKYLLNLKLSCETVP